MIDQSTVAIVCYGDESYGVGTALKLYAEYMPGALFLAMRQGALTEYLRQSGLRFELVGDVPRSSVVGGAALSVAGIRGALSEARKVARVVGPVLGRHGIRVFHAQWIGQHLIGGYLREQGILNIWHIQNNTRRRWLGLGLKMNQLLARRHADVIMPVSDFIGRNWAGSGRPIVRVWNAAKPIFAAVTPAPEGPFRCLVAGRLEESKGHHLALEAVIAARRAGIDVTLDIFGGPTEGNPYADQLRQRIAATGNQGAITLKGFVDDLRQRHPSYHLGMQCRIDPEPCSLWVCETLSDGLPLLASASGGTPELELEGVTGRLYEPGNQGEITEKLQLMLRDPDGLRAMRQAAFERGQAVMHPTRMIRETLEAYEVAANRSSVRVEAS